MAYYGKRHNLDADPGELADDINVTEESTSESEMESEGENNGGRIRAKQCNTALLRVVSQY